MASSGHSVGDSSPPHPERPRRDRQLPRHFNDYDVELPPRFVAEPLHSRSMSSLAPAQTRRMLDLSVSHSLGDIARLDAARLTSFSKPRRSDVDYTDKTHRGHDGGRTQSRPDSPSLVHTSTSGRNDNKELLELLKQQMVAMEGAAQRQATAWLEREQLQSEREAQREQMQAQTLAELAKQQAERERLQVELQLQREQMQAKQQAERERMQAETSLQSLQLLTEALQNRSARPSAQSSRRTSRRGSRQHSPEQRGSGGRNEQDPLPGLKEETGEVAAELASRLQKLEDEMQDRSTPQCIVAPDACQAPPPPSSQNMAQPPSATCALPRPDQAGPTPADTGQFTPPSNSQFLEPRPSLMPRPVPPYVEETTFPNFTKEDRSQYTELRMCLETLLTASQDERYKYALLLRHVKVPRAHNIALAYAHSTTPYSDALAALDDRYGRPWDFVLQELREIEKLPPVKDDRALDDLSVRVQSLVGMLQSQQQKGFCELYASSNVERILNKLPKFRQERFRRQRNHLPASQPDLSLIDLSNFLRTEVRNLGIDPSLWGGSDPRDGGKGAKGQGRPTTVMLQNEDLKDKQRGVSNKLNKSKAKPHCPYCDGEHWLHACADFKRMNQQEVVEWIKTNRRCWRCARQHKASECNLKKRCTQCQATHLNILHDVNRRDKDQPTQSTVDCHYIDPAKSGSAKVMLKIVRVHLHHGDRVLDTYAVLDDGSERTLLLASAANKLGLQGREENLTLRTIRRDLKTIEGERVAFAISPADQPHRRYQVGDVFTSKHIGLSQYDYPIHQLQERFQHLRHLPIPPICEATPTLLIGSDHTDLITPVSTVYLGPRGCPAAIKTRLGWTLQGPIPSPTSGPASISCLYSKAISIDGTLMNHIERLWQLDTLPFKNEKQMVRSKEDKYAVTLLEQKTTRVEVQGVQRYATPLLRRENMPKLHVSKEVVSNYFKNTERRLAKNPQQAAVYREEINKLVVAGHVKRIDNLTAEQSQESWYLPHHKVSHNGKDRVVFNCSFQVGRQCLNRYLLPGPTLGPSLLGVLMRFRQDKVAISGDIKGMFHQVRLLEEDKPLLRFLWRDNPNDEHPSIYQWQVLPFGTTCSPCCAIFALQQHVSEDPDAGEDVRYSVERCFYVDNCLQSVATEEEARTLIIKLRTLLARGGFDLRQWASSNPNVLSQLPPEAKARSSETWMAHSPGEAQEMTLGLVWRFKTDTLHYRHTPPEVKPITRRRIYSILASQYDPLGYILPYTTRAKVLVRELWAKEQGWDDPLPDHLAKRWREWEEELPLLREITLPRSYFPPSVALEIRRRFWILQGREAVRRFQRTCTDCQRWRAQPAIPKMADLPPCRLKIGEKAFHATGVDCFGPFLVKRGRGTEKRWGIVYKCMTTRAVHIELLQSMSADSFLMSFRRFQARRGTPATLLSDHGTNFKGGESELRESFEAMTEEVKTRLAPAQVHFQFNPPNAPHFGGTWEREVRSIKTALYTVLGAQTVGDEVLATVLTEIEGVLNSKPLGYVSTDIADVDPVTPNYLLMGRLDPALPQGVYNQDEMRGRRMWRHSQVLADQFWSHFLLYYLPSLQARQKWVKDKSNLTEGTVVMVVDQSLPRALWPVGRVSKVIVGSDGKVRAADVLVRGRTYTRPVAKLIELPAFPGPHAEDPASATSSS